MTFTASALRSHVGPGRTLVLRSAVGLTGPDPESRTAWAHIAKCGEWQGHPSGAFSITPTHLASVIACFDAQTNPTVMDYEHQSTTGERAPAAGWIQKLEVRDEVDLWALIEWTETGAAHVRAGEYRYASAVLFFDAPLRESGEAMPCRLHSCACTNCPFVDDLTALALSERIAARPSPITPAHVALAEGIRPMAMIPKKTITDAIKAAPAEEMSPEAWAKWIEAYLGASGVGVEIEVDQPEGEEIAASDKGKRVHSVALAESAKTLLAQIASLLKVEITEGDDVYGKVYDAIRALQGAAQVEAMLATAPSLSDDAKTLARALRVFADVKMTVRPKKAHQKPALPVRSRQMADVPGAGDAGAMLAARLVEASGMDAAAVLAAVEANLDAVMAALKGTAMTAADPAAATATAATEAALKETRKALALTETKLTLSETRLAALEPQVKQLSDDAKARAESETKAGLAARASIVDRLVVSGQVPETSRGAWLKLSEIAPAEFHADIAKHGFRVDLTDVPLGRDAAKHADPSGGAITEAHPRFKALSDAWNRDLVVVRGEKPEARKARVDARVRAQLAQEGS